MRSVLTIVLIFVISAGFCQTPAKKDSLFLETNIPLSDILREKIEKNSEIGDRVIKTDADQKGFHLETGQKFFQELNQKGLKGRFSLGVDGSESQPAGPKLEDKWIALPDLFAPLLNVDVDESEIYDLKPVRPFDSRFEISNLTLATTENQAIIVNSFSVMGIVSSYQLARTTSGYSAKDPVSLQDRFGLCPDEPYCKQPALCMGTAFLIAPDVIVTARHNLDVLPLKDMMFIIGYKVMIESGTANLDFETKDVYRAKSVYSSNRLESLDLTVVRLDRAVVGASPLNLEPSFNSTAGERVYALGYPLGLPMKYITNASISGADDPFSFYTTLDTFKGNSGSPVFSRTTHRLIGVLVEGGVDLTSNGNCQVSKICGERNCKGEKVINISLLSGHITALLKK